jgi:hypothetical protein
VARYDGPWADTDYEPGWELDRVVPSIDGIGYRFKGDRFMRPIRDNPGTDETLMRCPVPGVKWTIVPDRETT